MHHQALSRGVILTSDAYQNLLEVSEKHDSWFPFLKIQIQVDLGWCLYGQATQDGSSLALCISPASPVPASPTP